MAAFLVASVPQQVYYLSFVSIVGDSALIPFYFRGNAHVDYKTSFWFQSTAGSQNLNKPPISPLNDYNQPRDTGKPNVYEEVILYNYGI